MLNFMDNNQASKNSNNFSNSVVLSSKNEKQNRSEYVKRIIPATRVLPITRIDLTESMDTNIKTEYEIIAKPEEAGGTI